MHAMTQVPYSMNAWCKAIMPAFKSAAIQTVLVNAFVTPDHIRCKQAFVSSCAHIHIKWQAAGEQRIKDHLRIASAGFSKWNTTILVDCSGSFVSVLQTFNHLCRASAGQVLSASAQDGLTMKRQSRCRRLQGSWCFHHTGCKHQKHTHHTSPPWLWDLQDMCSISASTACWRGRSWHLIYWCLQNGKGRQHDSKKLARRLELRVLQGARQCEVQCTSLKLDNKHCFVSW